jgi:O-methyltransferase involved in polyketide biosynthesis
VICGQDSLDALQASVDRPSSARVYDYILGGTHHYAIDRDFAERQLATMPEFGAGLRANRAFLGRAVRYALDQGVRQFVDIGSGLPMVGNVHEVADEFAPGRSRVVYIDNEPIVQAHADILLAESADPDRHRALLGDYFDYADLWNEVVSTGVIEPDEPVCLLIVGILHFLPPGRNPLVPLRYYRDRLPRGSLLVLSHNALTENGDERQYEVQRNYQQTNTPMHLRTRTEFAEFFGGWELVEPGVTWAPDWRPDSTTRHTGRAGAAPVLAGVARRPDARR